MNNMKANELMIGDWVHVEAHRGFNAQNVKVETIPDNDGDNEYGHHYGHIGVWLESDDNDFRDVEAKHLQPIPLTPEILEKNGFVTNDEQGNWKGYRMYSLFNKNKSCIFMLKLYEKDSIGEISLNMSPYYIVFKYVHQLQHALRLCGIKIEIEL